MQSGCALYGAGRYHVPPPLGSQIVSLNLMRAPPRSSVLNYLRDAIWQSPGMARFAMRRNSSLQCGPATSLLLVAGLLGGCATSELPPSVLENTEKVAFPQL